MYGSVGSTPGGRQRTAGGSSNKRSTPGGGRGSSARPTPAYSVQDGTPGSVRSPRPGAAASADSLFIVSLVENRATEVGIAALDLNTNSMYLTQIGDNTTYASTLAMLTVYNPKEVLVSGNARQTKLTRTVRAALPDTTLSDIERKYFSDTEGMLLFRDEQACVLVSVTLKELESKYLCACAAFALHRYAIHIQRAGPLGMPFMKVSYKVHEHLMLLDFNTLKCLEIIENTKSGNQKSGSLFATVNDTQTSMGARLLRSTLIQVASHAFMLLCNLHAAWPTALSGRRCLQPLKSADLINQRLDAVEEIVDGTALFIGLQAALQFFPDLEQVTSYLLVKSSAELVTGPATSCTSSHFLLRPIYSLCCTGAQHPAGSLRPSRPLARSIQRRSPCCCTSSRRARRSRSWSSCCMSTWRAICSSR